MTRAFKCCTRFDDDDDSVVDDLRAYAVVAFKSRGITRARPMVTLLAASHALYMFRPQPAHHANARSIGARVASCVVVS